MKPFSSRAGRIAIACATFALGGCATNDQAASRQAAMMGGAPAMPMAGMNVSCPMHQQMMAATPEQRQAMMNESMKGMTPEMRAKKMAQMAEQCRQ